MLVLIIIAFVICNLLTVNRNFCFNHTLCDSRLLSYRKHTPPPLKGCGFTSIRALKMSMSAVVHLFLLSPKPCSRGVLSRFAEKNLCPFKIFSSNPQGLTLTASERRGTFAPQKRMKFPAWYNSTSAEFYIQTSLSNTYKTQGGARNWGFFALSFFFFFVFLFSSFFLFELVGFFSFENFKKSTSNTPKNFLFLLKDFYRLLFATFIFSAKHWIYRGFERSM